ncbi:hypothetical protein JOF56_011294 [Kibdelosporangium banguiense]|uniref:DUF4260 domain-containing protein n=1 Tax=Kibdelosporangium banguiense TaxID=1365924 RepID=A0ABS4U3X4_9PSEU|nr:DUF4260 family protein [Kibdelosporangium banguiense]MBP2330909.1 hypothetical protein [Kibdelosporangium banguiense]
MSLVLAPARPIAQRVAWGVLAVFLLAFLVFEVVKHGGATWATALLLLIAPDLTMFIGAGEGGNGKLSPKAVPFYNAMHRPWIPLTLLVGYSFSNLDWVPLFTAGLAWLLHIASDRAFGYGLRASDGSRRV